MEDRVGGDDNQPETAPSEIEIPHIEIHEFNIDFKFGRPLIGTCQHIG